MEQISTTQLTKKNLESDQAVRWCPGCGDYAILSQTQKTMPDFGRKKEEFAFIITFEFGNFSNCSYEIVLFAIPGFP